MNADIFEIIPEAVKRETAFLAAHPGKQSLVRDGSYPGNPYIAPADIMFSEREQISVKINLTDALKENPSPSEQDSPSEVYFHGGNFLHRHNFFEINYLLREEQTHLLGEKTLTQTPADLLLMNPFAVHMMTARRKDTIFFNLLIRRSFADEIFTRTLSYNQEFTVSFLIPFTDTAPEKRLSFLKIRKKPIG